MIPILPSHSSFLYPFILRYLVSFNFHFPSLYPLRSFYSLFRFFFFLSLVFILVYYFLTVSFIATMEHFGLDPCIYTRFEVLVAFYIFSSFPLFLRLVNRLSPFIWLFRFDRPSTFRFRSSTQSFWSSYRFFLSSSSSSSYLSHLPTSCYASLLFQWNVSFDFTCYARFAVIVRVFINFRLYVCIHVYMYMVAHSAEWSLTTHLTEQSREWTWWFV